MLAGWGLDRLVSADALDLLNGLLCPDPRARYTMAQVEAHPWFRPLGIGAVPVEVPVPPVVPVPLEVQASVVHAPVV